MKILVTGGLGVIGSLFVRRMLAAQHKVFIIDACEEPRNEWLYEQLKGSCEVWRGRLEHAGEHALPKLLPAADAVLHAAAHTGIPHSLETPGDDWASNVDATRVLLEALRKDPRPTVVLSSVKPYRITDDIAARGLLEDDPLDPDEPYAASKAAQSLLCRAYARSYGVPVTVFRCSNLYGPAPCHGPRHGWLTWMCISAAIGRPLEVQGTGDQSRDMLHASDVADAVMAALSNGPCGEIFNLGGGLENKVSVMQVARMLNELTGIEITNTPARAMDDDCVFVDHGKFSRATGWQPRVAVLDGLRETLSWAQNNKRDLMSLYDGA